MLISEVSANLNDSASTSLWYSLCQSNRSFFTIVSEAWEFFPPLSFYLTEKIRSCWCIFFLFFQREIWYNILYLFLTGAKTVLVTCKMITKRADMKQSRYVNKINHLRKYCVHAQVLLLITCLSLLSNTCIQGIIFCETQNKSLQCSEWKLHP